MECDRQTDGQTDNIVCANDSTTGVRERRPSVCRWK